MLRGSMAEDSWKADTLLAMATTLSTQLPDPLAQQAQTLVDEGWSPSLDALVVEALRRYCESHGGDWAETFLREDLEWSLRGND